MTLAGLLRENATPIAFAVGVVVGWVSSKKFYRWLATWYPCTIHITFGDP